MADNRCEVFERKPLKFIKKIETNRFWVHNLATEHIACRVEKAELGQRVCHKGWNNSGNFREPKERTERYGQNDRNTDCRPNTDKNACRERPSHLNSILPAREHPIVINTAQSLVFGFRCPLSFYHITSWIYRAKDRNFHPIKSSFSMNQEKKVWCSTQEV